MKSPHACWASGFGVATVVAILRSGQRLYAVWGFEFVSVWGLRFGLLCVHHLEPRVQILWDWGFWLKV